MAAVKLGYNTDDDVQACKNMEGTGCQSKSFLLNPIRLFIPAVRLVLKVP